MALSNIFLFTGEEKFIIQTKINRVISESGADEINIVSYDCEEVNLKDAILDASTPPFMSKKKVVIIKNPSFLGFKSQINHDLKSFDKYVNNPLDSTILIIDGSGMKINEKSKALDLLRKKAVCNDTKPIDETIFSGWITRQCSFSGVEIKEDAIKTFIRMVGFKDLTNAKTEVDKLICYVGEGGVITKDIVSNVCTREIQGDIFSLANAIISSDKDKAIGVYMDLMALDNDVNAIISLVTRTIRESLVTKSMVEHGLKQNELALKMGISPQRAYHLIKNSKEISKDKCEEYLIKLGDLDYKIKSGQIDAKSGFEFFLFGI